MPDFRCKMLDERGGILFSEDITADTLDGAIRHASNVLHTSNLSSPSRRVYAFEVWSGTSRLFPPPLLNACAHRGAGIRRLEEHRDEVASERLSLHCNISPDRWVRLGTTFHSHRREN